METRKKNSFHLKKLLYQECPQLFFKIIKYFILVCFYYFCLFYLSLCNFYVMFLLLFLFLSDQNSHISYSRCINWFCKNFNRFWIMLNDLWYKFWIFFVVSRFNQNWCRWRIDANGFFDNTIIRICIITFFNWIVVGVNWT